MFTAAILIGLYGYLILFLGVLGSLSKQIVLTVTLIFVLTIFVVFRKKYRFHKISLRPLNRKNLFYYILIATLVLLGLINLIGALGPELAFDALWYHLTLPKLYLQRGSFFFISGGTLYYSTMPQLTEMFYLASLALHSEILAKIVHFIFGLGICLSIYKIAKHYLTSEFSLLAALIFYSNLVVAWESITAYIDLSRTFFELLAFWGVIKWIEDKKEGWLIYSGLIIGLAISTKLLSFGTLGLMLLLILFYSLKLKEPLVKIFKNLFLYISLAVLVPLPWFIHAFINRGNPFYPLFSADLQGETQIPPMNPFNFIQDIWQVFTHAADPVSPVYIVFLPLSFLIFKKLNVKQRLFFYFSAASIVLWYLTPRTGGGRFLVPFLPVFSILVVLTLNLLKKERIFFKISIIFILFISLTTIFFRGIANYKYLNFVLGKESKEVFLRKHLEFNYGNFADIDGYFTKNIKSGDRVLLYGFHNLYYVNFPFIDGSWVKKGDRFNYIAVKEGNLPERFRSFKKVYSNETTQVKLYSSGSFWTY